MIEPYQKSDIVYSTYSNTISEIIDDSKSNQCLILKDLSIAEGFILRDERHQHVFHMINISEWYRTKHKCIFTTGSLLLIEIRRLLSFYQRTVTYNKINWDTYDFSSTRTELNKISIRQWKLIKPKLFEK